MSQRKNVSPVVSTLPVISFDGLPTLLEFTEQLQVAIDLLRFDLLRTAPQVFGTQLGHLRRERRKVRASGLASHVATRMFRLGFLTAIRATLTGQSLVRV